MKLVFMSENCLKLENEKDWKIAMLEIMAVHAHILLLRDCNKASSDIYARVEQLKVVQSENQEQKFTVNYRTKTNR